MDAFVFTRANGEPVRCFGTTWGNCGVRAGVGRFIRHSCQQPVDEARRDATCIRTWRRNDLQYSGLIFQDLRRSAARNLRNHGVGETMIMAIGGWKTRSVMHRYSIVSQGGIADAMLKLSAGRQREAEAENRETEPFGHNFGPNGPVSNDFRPDGTLPTQRRN